MTDASRGTPTDCTNNSHISDLTHNTYWQRFSLKGFFGQREEIHIYYQGKKKKDRHIGSSFHP